MLKTIAVATALLSGWGYQSQPVHSDLSNPASPSIQVAAQDAGQLGIIRQQEADRELVKRMLEAQRPPGALPPSVTERDKKEQRGLFDSRTGSTDDPPPEKARDSQNCGPSTGFNDRQCDTIFGVGRWHR